MKKFLALFLTLALLVTVAACGNKADDANDDATPSTTSTTAGSTTTTTAASTFVKPDGCVSVIEVSINPQFRLYLDAEDVVLAVECVNADAIAMEKDLSVVNTKYDKAVTALVSAANDKGFVKADTVVKLALVETTKPNAVEMMEKAETAVADLATDLEISFNVTVSEANNTTQTAPSQEAAENVTTSTTKTPSTKAPTTTTTTTTKASLGINKITYFSYSRPIEKTDYSTNETYLVLFDITVGFYPEGGSFMDGDYDKPVFSVFADAFTELIPKTNYPTCQQSMVDYYLENHQHMLDDFNLTWADLFERKDLREYNTFTTYNGVEYLHALPGFGGFSIPFYSYTINSKTGAVTYQSVYDCEMFEDVQLVSLTLKSADVLSGTFVINGKTETIELTATQY